MANIKFERIATPLGSFTVAYNPRYGDFNRGISYMQPMKYSAGGDLYVYDKGLAPSRTREFTFKDLSASEYQNLITFLDDVVVGAKYDFIFTDIDGGRSVARIINGNEITGAPIDWARESLSVKLRLSGDPDFTQSYLADGSYIADGSILAGNNP